MTLEPRPNGRPGPSPYDDLWRLAQRIANTEFVPAGLRGRPEAVLACILTGRALGIDEMVALANIDVINGRPDTSAELMRALVLRAGHSLIWETSTGEKATLTGVRADTKTVLTLTWTLEDAERAQLLKLDEFGKPVAVDKNGKPLPWQAYTRVMLRERVTKELCRALFADVLAGLAPEIRDTTGDPEPYDGPLEVQVNLDGSVDMVPAVGAGSPRPAPPLPPEARGSGTNTVPVGVDLGEVGDPDRDIA